MCGIVGHVGSKWSAPFLTELSKLLQHRGPDDSHAYLGDNIALAARRLSILDLAGGRQPLSNEDGSIWIIYNGEIVNNPELRIELEQLGHQFRTKGDTETLVHAYESWGYGMLARLRGMYAFAIWDSRRQRLFCARDRFGIKPFYYRFQDGQLTFASEIAPLLAAAPTPPAANLLALEQLFCIGHIPSPLTPFASIRQLPAAHQLIWEDGEIALKSYWQLELPLEGAASGPVAADAQGEFNEALRDAVSSWRLSDVPVGALLSGGLDSSSLAALLTELSGPIHTFNIGFSAERYDESALACLVADHIGSQHRQIQFDSADFGLLPTVIRHLESPQLSLTSIPIYQLYQACHEAGFKVVLTGEGADELLGGYHWFAGDRRLRPLLRLPAALRQRLAQSGLPMSSGARHSLVAGSASAEQRYFDWHQVGNGSLLGQLLAWEAAGLPPYQKERQRWRQQLDGRHPFDQFVFLDSQTRMVDFINFEVDRLSMAHSVEARPPFLDHRLWEMVVRMPPRMKLGRRGSKLLLRKAMETRLPRAITARRKQGLATPHADWWLRRKLPDWAEEHLSPGALKASGYFQPTIVGQLRRQHESGQANHSRWLTGVLTTQVWHELFIAGRTTST